MSESNEGPTSRSEVKIRDLELETARLNRKASAMQVTAGVLTVAVAIGGFFSFFYGIRTAEQSDEIANLRVEVSDKAARLDVADKSIRELQSENLDLRRAVPATLDPADIPALQRTQTLKLTSDYELDLESVLPNFDLQPISYLFRGLAYEDGVMKFNPEVGWLQLPAGQVASYETCSAATDWRQETRLNATRFESNDMCLRLESGRTAIINATNVEADQITLSIAVYELP